MTEQRLISRTGNEPTRTAGNIRRLSSMTLRNVPSASTPRRKRNGNPHQTLTHIAASKKKSGPTLRNGSVRPHERNTPTPCYFSAPATHTKSTVRTRKGVGNSRYTGLHAYSRQRKECRCGILPARSTRHLSSTACKSRNESGYMRTA